MDFPIVNFRLLARNFNMFGFEMHGSNKPNFYSNIEEVEYTINILKQFNISVTIKFF